MRAACLALLLAALGGAALAELVPVPDAVPDAGPVALAEGLGPLPYVLNVNLRRGGFVARGTVPDATVQAALAAEGVSGPRLLAGPVAPGWQAAALAGLAGLRRLEVGQFELRGRALSVLGTARTPDGAQAAEAAVLAALPVGYTAAFTLDVLDDLTPPAYRLSYAVERGVALSGKLPVGIAGGDVARALGIADLDNGAETALEGPPGALSPVFAVLRDWLARVETLEVQVAPGGTSVALGLGRGWSPEAVRAALAPLLPGVALSVEEVFARG